MAARQARVVLDTFGNAVGGIRTPYLDVPPRRTTPTRKVRRSAPNWGTLWHSIWARLNTLYGTPQTYAAKVAQSVDKLVRGRWLTESDGRKIKAEGLVPATAPH